MVKARAMCGAAGGGDSAYPEPGVATSDDDPVLLGSSIEIVDLKIMNQELLIMYFENKRRSGGGPLVRELCEFHLESRRVVLTFTQPEGKLHIYTSTI